MLIGGRRLIGELLEHGRPHVRLRVAEQLDEGSGGIAADGGVQDAEAQLPAELQLG